MILAEMKNKLSSELNSEESKSIIGRGTYPSGNDQAAA